MSENLEVRARYWVDVWPYLTLDTDRLARVICGVCVQPDGQHAMNCTRPWVGQARAIAFYSGLAGPCTAWSRARSWLEAGLISEDEARHLMGPG